MMKTFLALATACVAGLVSANIDLVPRNVMTEARVSYRKPCDACCEHTNWESTIKETYYSTITETQTVHDTQVQHTTDFVTQTVVSTFTTSYPVTVTKLVNCTKKPAPAGAKLLEVSVAVGKRTDSYKTPAPECDTVTTTEWRTDTSTKTVIVPTVVPTTLVDYTTVTRTVNQSVTKWVTTTLTATVTRTSRYPVTTTVDHSVTLTTVATTTATITTTFTTSYPVISTFTTSYPVSTITLSNPGSTVTVSNPGSTITAACPVPTITVTKPVSTITVSNPVSTITVSNPASTVTLSNPASTVTLSNPASTVTLSNPASTVTLSNPASTVTLSNPASTVTLSNPASTITSSYPVISTITSSYPVITTITSSYPTPSPYPKYKICSVPSGRHVPLDPNSDLTFGCKPGTVCSPPKPAGCDVLELPPTDDYVCRPEECLPSPPLVRRAVPDDGQYHYRPYIGYFNLDPEKFGVSREVLKRRAGNDEGKGTPAGGNTTQSGNQLGAVPRASECLDECNNVSVNVLSQGKIEPICRADSAFKIGLKNCQDCVTASVNASITLEYVTMQFQQYDNYCKGSRSEPVKTTSSAVSSMPEHAIPPRPDSQLSSVPPRQTTAQQSASPGTPEAPSSAVTTATRSAAAGPVPIQSPAATAPSQSPAATASSQSPATAGPSQSAATAGPSPSSAAKESSQSLAITGPSQSTGSATPSSATAAATKSSPASGGSSELVSTKSAVHSSSVATVSPSVVRSPNATAPVVVNGAIAGFDLGGAAKALAAAMVALLI